VGTRFFARPDRPSGPPCLLYYGYRVFPGGKVRPGHAADHSPPSSAAVMEEYPLSGPHRACNGITLPLPFIWQMNECAWKMGGRIMSGEIRSSRRHSTISLYLHIKKNQYYTRRIENAEFLAFTSYTMTIIYKREIFCWNRNNTKACIQINRKQ